jgi:putative endonuclease
MKKYKKTIGAFGEELAKNFLLKRGYQMIESNIKIGYGEIDIVASLANRPVFVEVKTLSGPKMGPADEALGRRQIKILKKTIAHYCWSHRLDYSLSRLDFIAIDLDRAKKTATIKHYKDIF